MRAGTLGDTEDTAEESRPSGRVRRGLTDLLCYRGIISTRIFMRKIDVYVCASVSVSE